MKILLTGGTGFIGKEIGKKLAKKNHDIFVLTRQGEHVKKYLPFPCTVVNDSAIEHLEGLDAVINLAGEPVSQKWSKKAVEQIESSRVDGTINLIQALKKLRTRPHIFISASAIGYYGDRADAELGESAAKGEGFLADVCEKWETAAQTAQNELAARVAIVRIGVVLGFGGALEQMLAPFKLGFGGAIGDGNQWMSWIHVDDLASLFVWAVENEKATGIYNGVCGSVTNREFSQELAAALKVKLVPNIPAMVIKSKFGRMAQIVLASQKVISERIKNSSFKFRFSDLKSALSDILKGSGPLETVFEFEQWVPADVGSVFAYFENAANLQTLTPDWLNFHILNKSTDQLKKDTLINYRLKLYGFPFRWQTLIEDWQPNKRFVDVQLKGPYKKWHHTHEFEPLRQGTIIRDTIKFILPVGLLGYVGGGWKAIGDVKKIFEYRREKVHKLFTDGKT